MVKGRTFDSKTNLPVCYADISCSDKNTFTKSNSNGEFLIRIPEFPATLKIRKFGYKEESIIVNSPGVSILVSLTPPEIHKISGYLGTLQYASLLKKADEKFRKNVSSAHPDPLQKSLVYCRFTSSADSTLNSLFESYAQMNVTGNSLQEFQPVIARFASAGESIPGSPANRLGFNRDGIIATSSSSLVKYFSYTGFFEQDGNRIAFGVSVMGPSETSYYINLADTSIVYIKSLSKRDRKLKSGGSRQSFTENRISSSEISFSHDIEDSARCHVDFIIRNESVRVIQKNKPGRLNSNSTLFAIIPDSSAINNIVKDYVLNENLSGAKQQINFAGKYSLFEKSPVFESEIQKLFLRPYSPVFWAQNTLIKPDSREQKQIQSWETNNRFYSENSLSLAKQVESDSLVGIMNKNLVSVEKVYLETDRPSYLTGDTIWFSAFVLDNRLMDSTSMSKILYVDLINPQNKPEKQLKLLIRNGRTKGDFALNKELKNGIFRIRAYTNWMRNLQSDYLFEKDIPVYMSGISNLIMVDPVINKSAEGDSVNLFLQALLPARYKASEKKLDVLVRLNDSVSVRKNFSFKEDFSGSMGFIVPSSISCSFADIKFTLSDTTLISEQRLSLPLKPGIDVQFFPESGKMVAGIETVIAWKAEDKKGNPAEFEADITDANQNILTHISGNKSGVGKFEFTPQLSQKYKAVVTLSGNKYIFNLPVTEPGGFILAFNSDSSSITIKHNRDINKSRCYLLVSVRGVAYSLIEVEAADRITMVRLPFEKYPKGIVQITLLDTLYRPLAERLVFNNRPGQKMFIHIEKDKKEYRQREKVNLTITVTDAAANPAQSSLSMTVVDASKTDSVACFADIESYLWLASELKGKIDYSLVNLTDTTPSGKRNIDLVLMTQGWRNYLWNSIRYSRTLKDLYPVEKGFYLDGRVSNSDNRNLISDYKLIFFDANTLFNDVVRLNEKGSFKIEFPLFYDSHFILIQNRNRKNRIDDLRFTLDTFPVPVINIRNNEIPYISYKPGYLKTINEKFAEADTIIESPFKDIMLKEVIVKAKRPPRYYSKPDITINLDKTDPTGKKYRSLRDMVRQEFGVLDFILVVNGNSDFLFPEEVPVNQITDVKFYKAGCEYSKFLTLKRDYLLLLNTTSFPPVVSITLQYKTFRGWPKGAIFLQFQGIYQAREFYKPNYELNKNNKPDNRTTIYWNSEVKTDSTGKATVSFYNSDLKGKALIRISGVSYQIKDVSSAVTQYGSDRIKE